MDQFAIPVMTILLVFLFGDIYILKRRHKRSVERMYQFFYWVIPVVILIITGYQFPDWIDPISRLMALIMLVLLDLWAMYTCMELDMAVTEKMLEYEAIKVRALKLHGVACGVLLLFVAELFRQGVR